MNKSKIVVFLPLILATILVLGIFIGIQLSRQGGGFNPFQERKTDKIKEVMEYVKENYVDTINDKALTEKTIETLLQSLDPHSSYIPAIDYHETLDPLLGSFEGIGVQFRIEEDTITVITPISGGPSEKLGIRSGDRIIRIDGKNVAGKKISNNDVMRKLKGRKGTQVTVSIFRRSHRGLVDYTITRDVIPTYSMDVAYMATPEIGYIRLNTFSATTHEETNNAIVKLRKEGMKKLILDLRGNGGGYLQTAIGVADEFLPQKKLIVYTEGKNHPKEVSYASSEGLFEAGQLVVLVDDWYASASEIVAGAIQDNDRGTIIGRRSFGKGLVQEQLMFSDSSFVRLTVARYYTPTGRCIQKPYKNGNDAYFSDHYDRMLNGELEHPDSIHFADSLKYTTPGGKIVYGGGGIMPDIYVPIERDSTLIFYNLVVNKGILYQFAFDYTDRNRVQLEKYRTFKEFNRYFQITDNIYADFLAYASRKGIKHEGKDLSASDKKAKVLIKAYVGRNIMDNDAFYPLLNSIDPTFLKAISVLEGVK
jgi:carboxyl-terminal processing protease